jgi:glycosyltransferase involved in cell wall biosynthesis
MAIKSVHITNYYHRNSGGISTAYNKLLEGANRRERYVRLIVPGEESAVEEVGKFGRIYYVEANVSPLFDKRYRVLWPWKTYFLDKSPIKVILRDEKPDLIEIGEKYTLSLMAGLLRKGIMNVTDERPLLLHFSCERMDDNVGAFISAGPSFKRMSRALIRNYVFPMFDFHLTNSDYTAGELFDAASPNGHGPKNMPLRNFIWKMLRTPKSPAAGRIFVNQCGVDIQTFRASRKSEEKRAEIADSLSVTRETRFLLYAGRISPEKNVMLLPEIAKELTVSGGFDFRLLVAGAGPEKDKLAAECERSAPGKTLMLGHINDVEQLADLFANCDVFVHPNPREPFGITPLEAMASGLPVVAPNSGGLLSYANSENAWLCEPTGSSFANAIRDVLSDETKRSNKTQQALETSRRFDWETSVDNLFSLYDRMYDEFSKNRSIYDYEKAPSAAELSLN